MEQTPPKTKRDGIKSIRKKWEQKAHTKAPWKSGYCVYMNFSSSLLRKHWSLCMRLRIEGNFRHSYTLFRLTFAYTQFAIIENQPSYFSFACFSFYFYRQFEIFPFSVDIKRLLAKICVYANWTRTLYVCDCVYDVLRKIVFIFSLYLQDDGRWHQMNAIQSENFMDASKRPSTESRRVFDWCLNPYAIKINYILNVMIPSSQKHKAPLQHTHTLIFLVHATKWVTTGFITDDAILARW